MLYTSEPRKGGVFRHKSMMDLTWTPQPGQTWTKDAPKAYMEITCATRLQVFYKYVTNDEPQGTFVMARKDFEKEYCQLTEV